MKYISLLAFLFLMPYMQLSARNSNSLSLHYDNDNAGRNLAVTYHYNLQNGWYAYGGVKWFINSSAYKNTPELYSPFFKQLQTPDFADHFGLKLGLGKDLKKINDYCSLYAFYDFQFTKGNVDWTQKLWAWGIPDYEVNGSIHINAFANILGLGMSFKINSYMSMNVYSGLGITFFRGRTQDPSMANYVYKESAVSRMFGASLNYALQSRQPATPKKRSKLIQEHKYNSIAVKYDDLQTGRNLNVAFHYGLSNHIGILAGLKYQIGNRLDNDYIRMEKGESYYFKQFQPQSFGQHIGITSGITYNYTLPKTNISLMAFYNFQAMRCSVKNLIGLEAFSTPLDGSEEGYVLAKLTGTELPAMPYASYRIYGPVITLENYLGIGLKLKCSEKINLNLQGAIGYNFYLGPDTYQSYDIRNFTQSMHYENVPWAAKKSEYAHMFSIGLEYRLGNKL